MLTQVDTIDGFRKALDAERHAGRTVGLVPTMGALHAGHAALMQRASGECDVAAATIFVNPLQFAPTEDLAAYPRDPDGDRRVAETAGVQLLFTPSESEMYPGGRDAVRTTVSVPSLSAQLEGRSRPTHFDGVATVVAKLFAIAGPCRAYFGEKDFQQLAVIRRLVSDLSIPVEVVGCPSVRDDDGLALSSRNAYLTASERAAAPVLHRALLAGVTAIEAGERDPASIRSLMSALIDAEPLADVDYAEVVDANDLIVPPRLTGELRLLIAARLGRARLIDNMGVTV